MPCDALGVSKCSDFGNPIFGRTARFSVSGGFTDGGNVSATKRAANPGGVRPSSRQLTPSYAASASRGLLLIVNNDLFQFSVERERHFVSV
jgi:hypothetical protein